VTEQQILILRSDGNLWLATGPFGAQIPPYRVPVDGNVDLYGSFYALDSEEILVCGSDGNLWLEQGPYGQVPLPDSPSYPPPPSARYQIDGNVAAYLAWPYYSEIPVDLYPEAIFVLGNDGNLWLESEFGSTNPTVPPPRNQIDGNVNEFMPMSLQEVFVLGSDGNLWHEFGPFGSVPLPQCDGSNYGCRSHVASDIRTFYPVDSENVFLVDNNNDLSLAQGSGWQDRTPVDGDVAGIFPIDPGTVYVLARNGNLWLEKGPFGTVPLPLCSQTSGSSGGLPGLGSGLGCRTLVASEVSAFGLFPDDGGTYIVDGNLDLWQLGTPNVKIDVNVIDFQPVYSADQSAGKHLRPRGPKRPVRVSPKAQR